MAQLVLFSSGTDKDYKEWVVIDTDDLDTASLLEEYGAPESTIESVAIITYISLAGWPTGRALVDPSV